MKGILWLSLLDQKSPIKQLYGSPKHFHVTIQFDVTIQSVAKHLGKDVTVELIENCWNDEIQAVKVKLPSQWSSLCKNKNPHMTLSHKSGVAPKLSNTMLEGSHESEVLKNKTLRLRSRFFIPKEGEVEKFDSDLKNYRE